jgi:hypothetical protein
VISLLTTITLILKNTFALKQKAQLSLLKYGQLSFSVEMEQHESPTNQNALTETQSLPVPVQQSSIIPQLTSHPTIDIPITPLPPRSGLVVEPRRSKTGTERYDNYPVAANHIHKFTFNFTDTDLGETGAVQLFTMFMQTIVWSDTFERPAGSSVVPQDPALKTNYVENTTFYWKDIDGKATTMLNGSYTFDLIETDDDVVLPVTFVVKVVSGKFESVTSGELYNTTLTPADYTYFQADFTFIDASPSSTLPFSSDIFTLIENTKLATEMRQYEAYSIRKMRLDLMDCDNYLQSNAAILAYYVSDPARFVRLTAEQLSPTTLKIEPHFTDKKLFTSKSDMRFDVPLPQRKYFTKPTAETRFHSPGFIGLVPLGRGSKRQGVPRGLRFNYAVTVTVEIDYYCQTLIDTATEVGRYVQFDFTIPPDSIINQEDVHTLPYTDLHLPTGKYSSATILPARQINLRMAIQGLTLVTDVLFRIPAQDVIRLSFPNLRNFNFDYTTGIPFTVEKVLGDNKYFYITKDSSQDVIRHSNHIGNV